MAEGAARVLVVVNDPDGGPRHLPELLARHGLSCDVVDAPTDGLSTDLAGYAGLILLGGGFMPDDDQHAPWLAPERVLATDAISADIPTLGICLGGQLLALVGGGTVHASGPAPERGITEINLDPAAHDDAVFGGLGDQAHVIENHRDLITGLPASAVRLATSDRCPVQAFRLGRRVWGVQFHPEAPPERALEFTDERLIADGFDPQAVRDAVITFGDPVRQDSATLLDAFADVVAQAAGAASIAASVPASTAEPSTAVGRTRTSR